MASERTYLLVDGNNIIHSCPELKELHQRGRGLAHQKLRHMLELYQDASGERVVLVFDGRRERMQVEGNRSEHEVQVFYSDSSHTADDVIERLSAKYAKRHRLTVATNDLAEQDMVCSLGAEVISAESLFQRLKSSQGALDEWLDRHRRRG